MDVSLLFIRLANDGNVLNKFAVNPDSKSDFIIIEVPYRYYCIRRNF